MTDHPRIWLEPHIGRSEDRLWCEDKAWEDGTEYVRADLAEPYFSKELHEEGVKALACVTKERDDAKAEIARLTSERSEWIQERDKGRAEIARLTKDKAEPEPERREKSIGQMQVEELLANRPKVGPDWTDEQVKAALKSWFPSYVEDRDFDLFGEDMRAALEAALRPDTGEQP